MKERNQASNMKSRIKKKLTWKKVKGIGFCTLFLVVSIWNSAGKTLQVQAEEQNDALPVLKESAYWTDPENYCGEILMEVGNLRKYVEKYRKQTEPVVENPSGEVVNFDVERDFIPDGLQNDSFPVEHQPENQSENPAECQTESQSENPVEYQSESQSESPAENRAEDQPVNLPEAEIIAEENGTENALSGENQAENDRTRENQALELTTEDFSSDVYKENQDSSEDYLDNGQWQENISGMEKTGDSYLPQLFLVNYISEYFQLNTASVPQGCIIEEIPVRNQKGEDTYITKFTYPINLSENTDDIFSLSLPIILREEYRINVMETLYPVSQDEPLMKDRTGTGAFVLEKYEGAENTVASLASPELSVKASACDYLAELKADVSETKAGEVINYVLDIRNTGALPLSDISVKSEFSLNDIKAVWESSEYAQVNGKEAVIPYLKAGESCRLRMTAKLTQDQSGELKNHVVIRAKHPGTGGELLRETVTATTVTPLTADFTVEKTANRTVAAPGDTVTYQICIRNTGEKTLHSVIGTERFLNAGIQAQFVPKDGVVLNSTRTQALISSIEPGEVFALLATVTIPQYFAGQELINEVIVTSQETGTRQFQSQSKITLTSAQAAATVTPQAFTQDYYQTGNTGKSAYESSSKPKTGDDAPVLFYTIILMTAILSFMGIFVYRKRKSNVSKD